jgi:TRAP-type mannitol/chloroaromatic compound transport system substrate-binding protein
VLELLINQDRWNELSDRERGLIEGACLATLQATLADSARLGTEALAHLTKADVRIENFPDDVLAALRSAWTEIAKEEGDRDYFFRTVLDDIEKFRAGANGASAPNASAESDASAEAKAAQ